MENQNENEVETTTSETTSDAVREREREIRSERESNRRARKTRDDACEGERAYTGEREREGVRRRGVRNKMARVS